MAAHFAKRNTKFGGGGKRGRAKIPPPQPPSFLPARAFSFGSAARSAAMGQFRSKNVRAELYNSTNIKLSDFCPTDSAARSAERYGNTGSPSAGSKSLAILSICFAHYE